MTPASISARLDVRAVGRRVECVERCVSTNDLAWKAAREGAPHGTAFFAEEQTQGRGRRGRTWLAPHGTSILCSILLRPEIEAERAQLVTALGALAVVEVAAATGVEARVRFPNDVYVGDRKLAGVLVESRFVASRADLFVLGIGLNVNAHPEDLPATSLSRETGRAVDRATVARRLLEAADAWAARLAGPLDPWRSTWREKSDLPGRRVEVRIADRAVTGTVEDVDPLDGLVLRLPTGHLRAVRGEEVELLRLG